MQYIQWAHYVCASWGEVRARVHARGHTQRVSERRVCVRAVHGALSLTLTRPPPQQQPHTQQQQEEAKEGRWCGRPHCCCRCRLYVLFELCQQLFYPFWILFVCLLYFLLLDPVAVAFGHFLLCLPCLVVFLCFLLGVERVVPHLFHPLVRFFPQALLHVCLMFPDGRQLNSPVNHLCQVQLLLLLGPVLFHLLLESHHPKDLFLLQLQNHHRFLFLPMAPLRGFVLLYFLVLDCFAVKLPLVFPFHLHPFLVVLVLYFF
ncbi:hypothetical protein ECC02_012698 [Trypanosoma cruzi]|uniref:Uncharacterized protein n=1 Tax=Trypanosoma cruzi TaxID=5693 RepID=A0A7J6XLF2_TRYCR|nr:hypothetical protein ECC02_012698 [Trypanosoma cruzi]